MRARILLLTGTIALCTAPPAAAMPLQSMHDGRVHRGRPQRRRARASGAGRAPQLHAARRVVRHRRARRPPRAHPRPAAGHDAARHAHLAVGASHQPGRPLGAGRPAVDAERPHRLGHAARPAQGADAHVGAGRPLPPPRHPDARLACARLVRRRRRCAGLTDADRPLQRHRPDRDGRSGRAVRLVRLRALRPPAPSAAGVERRRSARDPRHERPAVAGDGRVGRLPARVGVRPGRAQARAAARHAR